MKLTIQIDQEDGRFIAEVLELPGVIVYGHTKQEAVNKVQALALRVLADRIEHAKGERGDVNFLPNLCY
jgi:predicted RNase H-like HicB family nuclease